jgi:hypothetical protein
MIRSKNAGPFLLTLDVMFVSVRQFELVIASQAMTAESIAYAYATTPERITVTPYPPALAIKVTIPRRIAAGDLGDGDVYGAQQYMPLADLRIEESRGVDVAR